MTKTVEMNARMVSPLFAQNVRALAFAAGTGLLTLASVLSLPQQAKAFGISDVTGYAEDLWEIGADGIGRAGHAIGDKVRDLNSGEITSNNPRPPRRVTGRPSQGGNARLPGARNPAGSSLPPARGAASSASGGLPTSGNSTLPPARNTASNSGTSLPTGNSATPPPRGTVLPTGDSALPPPRRPNETVPVNPGQRPTPITEEDTKPSKPVCNSKFENCSGKHDGHDGHGHHDKKAKKWKKDKKAKKWSKDRRRGKSNWSHKASNKKLHGNKRHERKLRIKARDNKKVKIRVNNRKPSARIVRKLNRRG